MGRLGVFFDHTLPTQLGVQAVYDGAWVGGPVLGPILLAVLVAAVVVALAVAVRGARRTVEGGSLAMVALAVVLFPFLYAAVPGTAYWIDGRYGIYLGPLVAVLTLGAAGQVAGAASTAGRARHRASATSSSPRALTTAAVASAVAVVVGATVLTLAGAHESSGVPAASPSRFFTGWTDPDAAMRAAVAGLEAHGLGAAYGDYWTAYDLDLVAGDRIAVSPSVLDVDRRPQLAAAVAAAPRVGWLFFAPDQEAAASAVFSNPQPGPGAYDEGSFERLLQTRGVPYRVVHLGVLDAVVPARPFGSLPPTPSPGPAPG
jgi:hypothetical protein